MSGANWKTETTVVASISSGLIDADTVLLGLLLNIYATLAHTSRLQAAILMLAPIQQHGQLAGIHVRNIVLVNRE